MCHIAQKQQNKGVEDEIKKYQVNEKDYDIIKKAVEFPLERY